LGKVPSREIVGYHSLILFPKALAFSGDGGNPWGYTPLQEALQGTGGVPSGGTLRIHGIDRLFPLEEVALVEFPKVGVKIPYAYPGNLEVLNGSQGGEEVPWVKAFTRTSCSP
jgi:hypothetical protein